MDEPLLKYDLSFIELPMKKVSRTEREDCILTQP
jgi:hypothetical protein